MTFEFISKPRSVVDTERGITLRYIPTNTTAFDWDTELEYSTYGFNKGELQFFFKMANIWTPTRPKPLEDDPHKVTSPNTSTTFILEDSLREGLAQGLGRTPSLAEYQDILQLIQEGFSLWLEAFVRLESDSRTYQLLIEKNMAGVAQRYPGRMPNYESWAAAYNKTM